MILNPTSLGDARDHVLAPSADYPLDRVIADCPIHDIGPDNECSTELNTEHPPQVIVQVGTARFLISQRVWNEYARRGGVAPLKERT